MNDIAENVRRPKRFGPFKRNLRMKSGDLSRKAVILIPKLSRSWIGQIQGLFICFVESCASGQREIS